MKIIRGINQIRSVNRGAVVTIGNFDGLHLGHQQLFKMLKQKGKALKRPTMVIIFEPQPNEFFAPNYGVSRLMRFREKVETFKEQGIDYVLCLRFNETLAMQTAEQFVTEVLVKKLATPYVLVGDDFHFGKKRQGDFQLLATMGAKYNYQAECMPAFCLLGARVSSTRIRELLQEGKLETAQQLLGKPFEMTGKIAHGDKRGRLLGFPTANIHLHRKMVPVSGVFIVKVLGIGNSSLPGVANVGTRPTISGEPRTLLEVHLLDFDQNIYGETVRIQFMHKLRDERKFESMDALMEQIQKDVQAAKRYFEMAII